MADFIANPLGMKALENTAQMQAMLRAKAEEVAESARRMLPSRPGTTATPSKPNPVSRTARLSVE